MNGGHDERGEAGLDELAAVPADAKIFTEEGLAGGGAEADEDGGFNDVQLGIEPWAARGDFAAVGLFVDAALADGFPLEMFYDVSDVNLVAVDADFFKNFVEKFAGGAYEGAPSQVFVVPGLLTDEEDFGFGRSFAKDCLRTRLPKRTGSATFGRCAQPIESRPHGNQRRG